MAPPQAVMPGGAMPFDVRTFEAMAQYLVADQRVPGLAVAIVQNGQVLSARGYGVTDTARPEPVDAHTVFRLASLSKSFAGTLAGMLVDEGAIDWQQPVVRYVPSFRLKSPEYTSRLSIANILSQSTGLPRNAFDRDIEAYASYPTVRGKLASAPLRCGPGECYSYQNVAFSVFGDVVHAATGRLYDDQVQARIFKPLGMHDSSLGLEGITQSPRWAKPHVRAGSGWRSLMPKPTYYRLAPAAGVNASIRDMAQYLIAQTGHRPDVLSPRLLSSIHASRIDTPTELRSSSWRRERLSAAGYGMGWRVYNYAGHSMYFHGGAVQGYRAAMALLPDRDLGVAILWNSESSLPSGLLPTILDSAIGLPQVAWLKLEGMPGYASSEELEAVGSSGDGAR
ncbi:serine hydrolase domain-containing protein [Luteimonas sp. e5]